MTKITKIDFLKNIERTYTLTLIDNELDLKTREVAVNQQDLFSILTNHNISDDKSYPSFIPASFHSKNTKSETEVRSVSLIVYDIDCKSKYYSLEDLKSKFKGYACAIYSTYSATYEHPRWRVILIPDSNIEPSHFKSVYLGLADKFDLEIDQACTNINRLFYLPSHSKFNDFVFSWSSFGDLVNTQPFIKNLKTLNRGYVSLSSVKEIKPKSKASVVRSTPSKFNCLENTPKKINGLSVPKPLKAPFSQEQFDELLASPATWLVAAQYMGLSTEGICSDKIYSKNFSSVIPGVNDDKPSCSLALFSGRTRLVYCAFNEAHETPMGSGPVKFDLAHIFAMMSCGRRIDKSEFSRAVHKVWLTRLLSECGMIQLQPVDDLPELSDEIKSTKRLYDGFKELLRCKRAFVNQIADATSFSLTFACYWCKIGNRNTAKKYTKILLENNILRFVDNISLARGGSIPLLVPAGQTAKIYALKNRKIKKSRSVSGVQNKTAIVKDKLTNPKVIPHIFGRGASKPLDFTAFLDDEKFAIVSDESAFIKSRKTTRDPCDTFKKCDYG